MTYPLTNSNDLACKVELLVVKVRSINVLKRREERGGEEERGGGEGGERRRGGEEGRGGGERRRGEEERRGGGKEEKHKERGEERGMLGLGCCNKYICTCVYSLCTQQSIG